MPITFMTNKDKKTVDNYEVDVFQKGKYIGYCGITLNNNRHMLYFSLDVDNISQAISQFIEEMKSKIVYKQIEVNIIKSNEQYTNVFEKLDFVNKENSTLYVYNYLKDYIGMEVTVKVDRVLGSTHPKHRTLVYPINYGYIDTLLAPDHDFQDAYILGENKPLSSFTGKVIAIINRKDDEEVKFVVANDEFDDEAILEATSFQEQFFDSEIIR